MCVKQQHIQGNTCNSTPEGHHIFNVQCMHLTKETTITYTSQVQQLLQLLQTPYAPPPSCPLTRHTDTTDTISQTVVDHTRAGGEKGDEDMTGGGDSRGTERREDVREGASVVTTAVAAEIDGGVSRYYSKPPDWALTLCVT